jgi:uncharacterized membrane protein
MPAQTYWLAMAVLATLLTFAWLFVERRIYMTGLFSGLIWLFLALTGDDVYRITETGEQVAAPVGVIQYFTLSVGLLSFLAVILYHYDHYPPDEDFNDNAGEEVRWG